MTLGTSAIEISSLAVEGESDAPFGRGRLRGGQIQTKMRNAAQSLRTKVRGRVPQLNPGIVRPAPPLLHRVPAAERASQVEIQVGHRDLEGASDLDQPIRRDVLEAALDLGQVPRREVRGTGKLGQGVLRFLPAPPEELPEGGAHRVRIFAVSVRHLLSAYGSSFAAVLPHAHARSAALVLQACQARPGREGWPSLEQPAPSP